MTKRSLEEIEAEFREASSINDAEALLRLAAELDAIATPQADAAASRSRGWVHYLRGDFLAALENFHRALAIHEELGNRSGVAAVTGNIGSVHNSTGDYPVALEYFQRALALCDELGDRRGVAIVTGNIGNLHRSIGDYPRALEHHHRALALHEELGERSGVARAMINIGNVHKATSDYPTALEHYNRALAHYRELGSRNGVAIVMANIGTVYMSTGDHASALEFHHQALALYEELGEPNSVALVTANILTAYLMIGSDEVAQALLKTMDAMQIDEPEVRIGRELQRATLQQRSGDPNSAVATLRLALAEAQRHGLRSQVADAHRELRDLAQKRNDFTGYIEHNNEYTRITEEINGRDTATKLAMQAKQREIDAKDRETQKHLAVLHSTLPKHIADRVARGEVVNDHYDNASVIFLDIVGFTELSSSMSSQDVIALLDNIFTQCDAICDQYNVTKIKTIGDSYMAVAFETANTEQRTANTEQRTANTEQRTANVMPSEVEAQVIAHSVVRAANAAIEMMNVTLNEKLTKALEKALDKPIIEFRIGIHCGPVTAGVIGTQRMQYDVWGDTVNVASRMESTSEPGKIHVSEALANALNEALNEAHIVPRGEIEIKGKGTMQTYWLE